MPPNTFPKLLSNERKTGTYPPLKAPTGFLIGNGVATSANLLELVWKLRPIRIVELVELEETARRAGENIRDAIINL